MVYLVKHRDNFTFGNGFIGLCSEASRSTVCVKRYNFLSVTFLKFPAFYNGDIPLGMDIISYLFDHLICFSYKNNSLEVRTRRINTVNIIAHQWIGSWPATATDSSPHFGRAV
jgi:hypothetical protein